MLMWYNFQGRRSLKEVC